MLNCKHFFSFICVWLVNNGKFLMINIYVSKYQILNFNVRIQPQIYYIGFNFIYCGCQYSLITLFHFWSLMKYLWVMMWKNVRMRKWCLPFFSQLWHFSIMSYASQGQEYMTPSNALIMPLSQKWSKGKEYILKGWLGIVLWSDLPRRTCNRS